MGLLRPPGLPPLPRERCLTRAQFEVMAFWYRYRAEHGYPPTFREVLLNRGATSTYTAYCHFRALKRKGYLRGDWNAKRATQLRALPVFSAPPGEVAQLVDFEPVPTCDYDREPAPEGRR